MVDWWHGAAWLGASLLTRIPKTHIMGVIAVLLIGTAVLLAAETLFHGSNWVALSQRFGCCAR